MRIGRMLLWLLLAAVCAAAAKADAIDPKITLRSGSGSSVVGSDLTFGGEFTNDGQSVDFLNESSKNFNSMIVVFTTSGWTGAFSCEANQQSDPYFTNCTASGNTLRFFGENPDKTGIPSCEVESCGGTTSDFALQIAGLPQGTSASFDGTANVPEPGSAVMLLTGLVGLVGFAKRSLFYLR